MSKSITEMRGAMVRIATLMSQIPQHVVRNYMSEADALEVQRLYIDVGTLMPSKPRDNPDKRPVPPATQTGFYRSVLEVVQKRYPQAYEKWDRWDYKIFGPMSLDDEARVVVRFKNADGAEHEVVLAL